jgi:hypothetical protein
MITMAMVVVGLGAMLARASANGGSSPPRFELTDAAPSVDVLVDRFLKAIAANDALALTQLRVNESEYRTLIMPGSVQPGHPPQIFPERESKFFWGMLETKSTAAGAGLLRGYGGRTYTVKKIAYPKGTTDFAWYRAYRDPLLTLERDDGELGELRVGSIAEAGGRYKFIAFNSD